MVVVPVLRSAAFCSLPSAPLSCEGSSPLSIELPLLLLLLLLPLDTRGQRAADLLSTRAKQLMRRRASNLNSAEEQSEEARELLKDLLQVSQLARRWDRQPRPLTHWARIVILRDRRCREATATETTTLPKYLTEFLNSDL